MVFALCSADIDAELRDALVRGGHALQALRWGHMPVQQAVQVVQDCFTCRAVQSAPPQQRHFILREARGRLRDALCDQTPPEDLEKLSAAVRTLDAAADVAQAAARQSPARGLGKLAEVADRAALQQMMEGTSRVVDATLLRPLSARMRGAGYDGRTVPLFGGSVAGMACAQGLRERMEDASVAYTQDGLSVAAVFDGHGGFEVARALTRLLPKATAHFLRPGMRPSMMRACLRDMCAAPPHSMAAGALWGGRMAAMASVGIRSLARFTGRSGDFPSLDVNLRASVWRQDVGSTVVFTVVDGDNFYVANIGDSRAVLVQRNGAARRLTVDHNPHGMEYERVIAEQGEVVRGRLDGILNIARAMGDWHIRALGRRPQVSAGSTCEGRCIIMGSDGFFGVISDDEAARLTQQMLDEGVPPASIATRLTAAAIHAGSCDNVTVTVLTL